MSTQQTASWRTPLAFVLVGAALLAASVAGNQLVRMVRDRSAWQIAFVLIGLGFWLLAALYREILARVPRLRWRSRLAVGAYGLFATIFLADSFALLLEQHPIRLSARSATAPTRVETTTQLNGALIPDDVLGKRALPNVFGADANGFRNTAIPASADVVTIGDSQTWGKNATREDDWPSQFAALTHHSVYNISVSGYGPAEYAQLLSPALTFHPRRVIVGLYLGNDLWDAYHEVYTTPAYAAARLANAPRAWYSDSTVATSAEITNSLAAYHSRWHFASDVAVKFALGRLLLLRTSDDFTAADRQWALAHRDFGAVYDVASTHTVLTPALRAMALDTANPRIAEGLRLTKQFIRDINARAAAAGARLTVAIIPSKESVYAPTGESPNAAHVHAVQLEDGVRESLAAFFRSERIDAVDALPALRKAAARGVPLYPSDADGHPLAGGYAVIAEVLSESQR